MSKPRYIETPINFTSSELKVLEDRSRREGMSLSVYVRRVLFSKIPSPNHTYRRIRDGEEIGRGGLESFETLCNFITIADGREIDANNPKSLYLVYLNGELSHIIWLIHFTDITSMELATNLIVECSKFAISSFNGNCIIDTRYEHNGNGYGLYIAEARNYKERIANYQLGGVCHDTETQENTD